MVDFTVISAAWNGLYRRFIENYLRIRQDFMKLIYTYRENTYNKRARALTLLHCIRGDRPGL
ncbi:MAG: hypothetical protein JGK24_28370 [Microcoleus sp. PH2017_29_MFU_D_A]|uniref:hypothetical protein n=1 Tax=unclassified Microcoleus TaxID=2642155 RepID=UPI001D76F2BD|nr:MULTISPECIES: hypothetical protein [unclassified Microcoleus]MCC3419897.1 hypothetical protein [Microcoleus sp. PH2017_07_MST_O_A]MCC3428468.1 hypothetical protein [Microcoleus sp. PH2017_01_SCD_O_A]MCC3456370.1 hypothetical protein [Microcoleus sp. PH2017_08_TRC_O_A]MCC3607033.1 hypothetical protein [Microcoleus sp. PH2017_29_MFU_D_A]